MVLIPESSSPTIPFPTEGHWATTPLAFFLHSPYLDIEGTKQEPRHPLDKGGDKMADRIYIYDKDG